MRNKRGTEMLAGELIFVILNLVFISILIVFLVLRVNDMAVLEQMHAKQIALIIDSAKSGMAINLNMEKAFDNREKGFALEEIVAIDNEHNLVTVKLHKDGGYSYSFFNEAEVNAYLDITTNKEYVIIVN